MFVDIFKYFENIVECTEMFSTKLFYDRMYANVLGCLKPLHEMGTETVLGKVMRL